MAICKLACMFLFFLAISCKLPEQPPAAAAAGKSDWKQRFDEELPLLGHRNWVLVVDKAFPMQTAAGMEVIDTEEDLLPVLKYTLEKIKASSHVAPAIYTDKEINYISDAQVKGVDAYKAEMKNVLGGGAVQTILHDTVFTKLDAASKLFKVLVLKTNETIAYSSVFLQLECAYWNGDQERQMRQRLATDSAAH